MASAFKQILMISAFFLLCLDYSTPAISTGSDEGMILIAEGEFIMGMVEGDPLGLVWATPQRKVYVPAFYIDRYEVTNENYRSFLKQKTNGFQSKKR